MIPAREDIDTYSNLPTQPSAWRTTARHKTTLTDSMHPHEEPRLERGSHRADALETKTGTAQRGDEWYVFDETSGLIKDIRGYNAALAVKDIPIGELVDFDYKGRGYHLRHK